MQASGRIEVLQGRSIPFAHDLAAPIPADKLEKGLRAMGTGLVGYGADQLSAAVAGLDKLHAQDLGSLLRG